MPITKKTTLSQMIHDFVNSDDPKFSNDSPEQRKKRAIGAYYSIHKESVNENSKTELNKRLQDVKLELRLHNASIRTNQTGLSPIAAIEKRVLLKKTHDEILKKLKESVNESSPKYTLAVLRDSWENK